MVVQVLEADWLVQLEETCRRALLGQLGEPLGLRWGATGGVGGLVDFRARPAGRYPSGGCGDSAGGTGSGRSGAVNFAGLTWLIWTVRSIPSSLYVT